MSGMLQMVFAAISSGGTPINTVAPVVSGTAQVRETLSCTTGTWAGGPPITYSYQWQSGTTNIASATSSTYTIESAYVGTTIRCVVTATNPSGALSANSNATSAVIVNTPAAPTIGTATATSSTTATVAFTANDDGGAVVTVFTATSSPGGLTGTSTGTPITVSGLSPSTSYTFTVTATNSVGTSSASSASNSITTSIAAPVNTVAPAVSGTAQVRQTLSCTTGTWNNSPSSYAYQWQFGTTNISGATSSTYVVESAYVGTAIRCVVTATNAVGSAAANSNATSAVVANTPLAPTIGTATATSSSSATVAFTANDNGGATVTAFTATSSPGGLTGTSTGTPITVSGLSASTAYTFTVTATNSVGTSSASSASNSITTSIAAPVNTVAPVISGTGGAPAIVYAIWTCTTGSWTGSPTSYSYVWIAGGTLVQNSTSATYAITSSDVGKTLQCAVVAGNSGGSTAAFSNTSAAVTANVPVAPTSVSAAATSSTSASVTFTAGDNGGATVTAFTATSNPGGITGTSTGSPVTVSGLSTGTAYTFSVSATNSVGTSSSSFPPSNSVTPGAAAPVNTTAPSLSGAAQVRNLIFSSNGTWTGAPAPTFTKQWQSSTTGDISGATGDGFIPTSSFVGQQLRCRVTGTNSSGSVQAFTAYSSSVVANTPEAPASVVITIDNPGSFPRRMTITSAVPDNGGSAITAYNWFRSVNGGSFLSFTSTASNVLTHDGTSGFSYAFKSMAVNTVGNSDQSPASNTVTLP